MTEGIDERKRRRVFPETFKREAVDRAQTSGLSVRAVAAELGLHETVLHRWIRAYGASGMEPVRPVTRQAPAPSPADLAAENARLRRENARLQTERDILKKAALIFGGGTR